jgi:nucleoside-diphosphate-sugar epimerase
MEPKHVIVTGAAGFLGGACVQEFLERGWQVTAMVHRHGSARLDALCGRPGLAIVRASVTAAPHTLEDALGRQIHARGGRCGALIHCAGRATDVGRDSAFRTSNLTAVENVCRLLRRLPIGRLVHMSTTDVYGVRDFACADEQTPLENNRRNPYAKYKIRAEEHIGRNLGAARSVILRPALVWGPGDTTVLPRAIAFLRASPAILHFGPWRGQNRWPLAYVDNVARVAYAAATCDAALGQVYNVVDPEPTSMDHYYRMLHELFFPERRQKRSLTLPLWIGLAVGAVSTTLSNLLNRNHPLFEPTLYGLRHMAHDQWFDGTKSMALLERCGLTLIDRTTALRELKTWCARGFANPEVAAPAYTLSPDSGRNTSQ